MHMENKRLHYLLDKYVLSTLSLSEEKELFTLLDSNVYDEQVNEYLRASWPQMSQGQELTADSSQKILAAITGEHTEALLVKRSFSKKYWSVAAAAILLIASFGLYKFYTITDEPVQIAQKKLPSKYTNDVAAGTNGAILKLADGSIVVLDSIPNGTVSTQGSMNLVKDGSTLNYVQTNNTIANTAGFNTIETPNGRQFSLMLGDGTKVWLNAASSIHFPVNFSGDERKVEITGEAYFEVAKNKHKPFKVSANGSEVEVLGTHFNVNSYADENTLNTTLLEGSVKVSHAGNNALLTPGQQAQVNLKGSISKINHVNITEVVAWKNNAFSFNNTDLKKLMRQLSRWYDVEIVYKNESADPVRFNGEISRSVTLSNVLKMLELTGEVSFSIEGKRIIVSS